MNRLKQSLSSIQPPSLPSFGGSSSSPSSPNDDHEARTTQPPLDPQRLARLTVRKRITRDLGDTFAQHVRTLQKQRTNPVPRSSGATHLASQWVGEAMVIGAQELLRLDTGDSLEATYAHVLASTGELYLQFTQLATAYHDQLSVTYLDTLERRADDFKDFEKTAKEAEKKRSVLETVMTKMEKGKKDPAEYEREVENAEDVYAEECRRLARKADRLEEALEQDVDALKQLVEVQLDYAHRYVSLLEACQASLDSALAGARSRPRSPPRQAPAVSSRMARSQSESSVLSVPTPTSSTSGMFSILGPNRSRRSTVSSQTSDGLTAGTDSAAKNRSRSGSMLERFALSKNKKKEGSPAETPNSDGAQEASSYTADPAPGGSSPTRGRITPSIPSMSSSFRKISLSTSGAGKYGTLGEDPVDESPASRSSSPPPAAAANSSLSFSMRRLPPVLRRADTAPAAASSPSSSSPRRAAPPPLPRREPKPLDSDVVVGRTFRAKWAYSPASASTGHHHHHDPDQDDEPELELVKGDVVRVVKEVNADWWIGTIVATAAASGGLVAQTPSRPTGMFPSAYVVPYDLHVEDGAIGVGRGLHSHHHHHHHHRATNAALSDDNSYSTATDDDDEDEEDLEECDQGLLDEAPGGRRARAAFSPFDDEGAAELDEEQQQQPPPTRRMPALPPRGPSSPFAQDQISHLRVSGQMSR